MPPKPKWSALLQCAECDGEGRWAADQIEWWTRYEECPCCQGTGRVSPFRSIQWWYWMKVEDKLWHFIRHLPIIDAMLERKLERLNREAEQEQDRAYQERLSKQPEQGDLNGDDF